MCPCVATSMSCWERSGSKCQFQTQKNLLKLPSWDLWKLALHSACSSVVRLCPPCERLLIISQWRRRRPGQRFVFTIVHYRIDGQPPEILAVLGARPSGGAVRFGSFQRFCMRSSDLTIRCIVCWEVWRIYLFQTFLWILREFPRAFGLNKILTLSMTFVTDLILFDDMDEMKNSG